MQKKGFYLLKGCIMRGAAGQTRVVLGEGSRFIAGSFLVCNELSLWKASACAPLERETQGEQEEGCEHPAACAALPCAITHPWDTAQSWVGSGPEHPLWGAKPATEPPSESSCLQSHPWIMAVLFCDALVVTTRASSLLECAQMNQEAACGAVCLT